MPGQWVKKMHINTYSISHDVVFQRWLRIVLTNLEKIEKGMLVLNIVKKVHSDRPIIIVLNNLD